MTAKRDRETGLTPREEAFAQALALGQDQSAAYRDAYPQAARWTPKTVWEKASRLAGNGKVQARVQQLQAAARLIAEQDLGFDVAKAFTMADEAFECARAFEQAGAMVAAATLKAKIAGLIVYKYEAPKGPLDGLSPGQVRELAAALEVSIKKDRAALPAKAVDHNPSGQGKD